MDLNKDGKVDVDDFHVGMQKVCVIFSVFLFVFVKPCGQVSDVLGYQMPAGGGFATGLIMGLRG